MSTLGRRLPAPRFLAAAATLLLSSGAAGAQAGASPAPAALLDTALARMGGAERLRGVERARFDMITQWQRIGFDDAPYADAPSYEMHVDLRDYTVGGWRNSRRFPFGGGWREITDLVRDSVAIRRGMAAPGASAPWAPLNVAYVDERNELFGTAPERVLLGFRDAGDLRAGADTLIAGSSHARLSATVDGRATTLLLRRGDGLPAMVRFAAAAPNDFGLVPWGTMEVETWYSGWRPGRDGITYPYQWDVRRVGRPYKRMTVLAAVFNPPAMPDSFAVSDSLRTGFQATARRPMHDLPLDSARLAEPRLAWFRTPGAPLGAVRLGNRWLLLEPGQAPLNAERAAAWLRGAAAGTRVEGAVATRPGAPAGGAAWLATEGRRVHAAPGAAAALHASLRGYGARAEAAVPVSRGAWLRVDGDSLWLEPIDLPDASGALIVYVPSLRWAYSAMAANPMHREAIVTRIRARGWNVERLGSPLAAAAPLP